jgi:acyl-CoA oxidase
MHGRRRDQDGTGGDDDSGARRELPAALLPLAPMLYVAWTDGTLTADELAAIRERARSIDLPDRASRAALDDWLDGRRPPSAEQLHALLGLIRAHASAADIEAASDLASVGAVLARSARTPGWENGDAARAALTELETVLGVGGVEAAGALRAALRPESVGERGAASVRSRASGVFRGSATRSASGPAGAPAEPPDPAALHAFLDADHLALRRRVLHLLSQPEFAYVDERDTAAYRETVLRWCTVLAGQGFSALAYPREFGGVHDPGAAIAAFETLGYHDLSMLVKYGVQFGLFAGSIYLLGTRQHHERYLRAATTLELPGCFAMTETGHGSNVRGIETTAAYDVARREFVIHTPSPEARKDYIGNAALHGRMAVVFAQLVTDTGHHGVHAFLVPLRDERGEPLPGVSIEDCGLKIGLNGVDNGRIAFRHVRIPRENLLDRHGSVSEGGAYSSPIPSATRRFFTMLGTLVAGRISIACASLSAAKSGLTIALRYADARRQFGPDGDEEVPILDYTVVQRSLIIPLATAYALDCGLKELVRRFAAAGSSSAQELEALAAALKAYASDWTAETLQAAREACGGQGYLDENRLGRLRADTDVFTTFEGANPVLYQLAARGRLTEYREQFGELKVWNIARHLGGRAATRVTELNPIVTRRTDPEHLLDPAFHAAALRYREERLTASLARRLRRRLADGMDGFTALNECQDHAVAVGVAFAERFLLEQFHGALDRAGPDLRPHLDRLCALYALSRLENRLGWYLESGYVEAGKAKAIRNHVNELCRSIRPVAVPLVDGFGIPDPLLRAPIATGPGGSGAPAT